MDDSTTIADLKKAVRAFNEARNWGRYHNPKDLAVSITIESAELLENFQWKTDKESDVFVKDPVIKARVEDEVADIAIYLIALCDRCEIDLASVVERKMEKNEKRFPEEDPDRF